MRGDFDINHSCWPIGYLRSNNIFNSGNPGPLYKLTDMRSLEPLIPQDLSLDDAVVLAAKINRAIRDKENPDLASLVRYYHSTLGA